MYTSTFNTLVMYVDAFLLLAQIHSCASSADASKTILQEHSMVCLPKGCFQRALLHWRCYTDYQ